MHAYTTRGPNEEPGRRAGHEAFFFSLSSSNFAKLEKKRKGMNRNEMRVRAMRDRLDASGYARRHVRVTSPRVAKNVVGE